MNNKGTSKTTKLKFRKRKKKNKKSTKKNIPTNNQPPNTQKSNHISIIIHSNTNTDDKPQTQTQPNSSTTDNNDNNNLPTNTNQTKNIINNNNNDNNSESDDNENDDLSFLNSLKQKNKLQFQTKDKGLSFEETHDFTQSGLDNPDNFKHDPSKDFDESFAQEKVQDDILKNQRDEWVGKEMKKRLAEQGRILPVNNDKNNGLNNNNTTLQEELYALPSSLSVPLTSSLSVGIEYSAGERWLAGMTEVELPIEYKLKNIQQTENAKKKLLLPKIKNQKIFAIPRNYNQDFTTHHYDRVKYAESKRKLIENKQKINIDRDRKRRRLMGPQFYTNDNGTDDQDI